ncbi:MAG: cation:proton antiporter domain-containing protein [Planctomycetota bacterium]|jgi:predicted Kef-type K+ transport protein
MDPLWITIAFAFGFAARQVGLPPLVGFLAAGFTLNAFDVQGGEILEETADLGVTLLLFTIGLKLKLRTLLKPEVWAGASLHMLVTVLAFGVMIAALSAAGLSLFAGLDWGSSLLLAFGLSFSSTVFAIKALEEKGEGGAFHGRTSIGILIMQDIFAVVFIVLASGKVPSPWAFLLLALIPARPVLFYFMDRCRHGELLVLFGMFLAIVVGAFCFEAVGLKGDLGALIIGILMAGHPKASELARTLMDFKNLFLVGFFLTIGLIGIPDWEAVGIALLLVLGIFFKAGLFFVLLPRFKLRARTALLASLSLATYSEFGLLVGSVSVAGGWIEGEWLVILALALSISFVIASPINKTAHSLYARHVKRLKAFERKERHPDDAPIDTGDARIIIFGMGRVGTEAYEAMRNRHGDKVLGFDSDPNKVASHREAGRNIIYGDALDTDFWERIRKQPDRGISRVIMLAMSNHEANLQVVKRLVARGSKGSIMATAKYDDEKEALEEAGAHGVFNIYSEAGTGFAEHVNELMQTESPTR